MKCWITFSSYIQLVLVASWTTHRFFVIWARCRNATRFSYEFKKQTKTIFDGIDSYRIHLLKTLKNAYEKVRNVKEIQQANYKYNFDKTHKNIEFNTGELVWVYFGLPETGKTQKLLPRFEGPYTVIQKLDTVIYRVQKDKKIVVAHVQRLLKFKKWES